MSRTIVFSVLFLSISAVLILLMRGVYLGAEAGQDIPPKFIRMFHEQNGERDYINLLRLTSEDEVSWLHGEIRELPQAYLNGDKPLSVRIYTGAAYEIYWNGDLIGENGASAANEDSGQTILYRKTIFVPQPLIRDGVNRISLSYTLPKYRSYLQYICGNWLLKACSQQIISLSIREYVPAGNVQYVQGFLMIGLFVVVTIVTGTLYLLNSRDTNSLWLSLTFLAVTVMYFATTATLWPLPIDYLVVRNVTLAISMAIFGFLLNLTVFSYLAIGRLPPWARIAFVCSIIVSAVFYLIFIGPFGRLTVTTGYITIAIVVSGFHAVKRRKNAKMLFCILTGLLAVSLFGQLVLGISAFFYALALIAVVHVVYTTIIFTRAKETAYKVQIQSQRLELELIKKNLQPHFLMNTLSALSEWIETSPKTSVRMIEVLAQEFRTLNKMAGKSMVPLTEELSLCRSHLDLMSFRQNRKFFLETEIAEPDTTVPPAIFHTLVENAFTHNRYSEPENIFSLRQSRNKKGDLQYRVETPPGTLRPAKKLENQGGNGLGSAYISTRLEESMKGGYSLEEEETPGGGWLTTITIHAQM